MSRCLGFCRFGQNRNERTVVAFFGKHHRARYEGKQGVVFADADVFSRMVAGAALANNDVAGNGRLTSEDFNAQSFAFRFASVLRTADAFLVCHGFAALFYDSAPFSTLASGATSAAAPTGSALAALALGAFAPLAWIPVMVI